MHHPIQLNALLFIPEIQYTLVSYLVDYVLETDLKSCQSVSRTWREAFTHHLWKVRSLGIRAESDRYETADARTTLLRIGRHVRHVRVHALEPLAAVLSFCPNITTLAVDAPLAGGKNGAWIELVTTINTCKRLETIAIRHWTGSSLAELTPGLSRTLACRLRHLAITTDLGVECPTSSLIDLLIALPWLSSLCLCTSEDWMIDHDVDVLKQHQFKLRSLQIHDDRHGLLFDLWRQCALLEDLDLSTLRLPPWIAATVMDEFASLFDQRDDHGHPVRRVKSLTLPALITIQDETLARVLRGCVPNRLTCLEVGESVIGRHTLRILLETQATSLERLTMEGRVVKGMDPGPWIQRLLCACPRLRELRMRSASSDITQVVRLHAHDIVGSSWVCSRLSSLHIPIIGIPTNLHTGADDNAVQMVNQVMRQIGKMKQLESLGTGFINDTSNTILRDTLPYSLGAGGLQHLASLKRLETLNVRRCAHRIRYAEARWMGEHWPRFREVNGLDRLWENDTSHPAQWLRSHGVYVPIS